MVPGNARFIEFDTPTPNSRPIGITPAADGALWFCENAGNRIGRITTSGAMTDFPVPTVGAGPDGIVAGPDGPVRVPEGQGSRGGRATPDAAQAEVSQGLSPDCRQPSQVVRGGELWFSEYEAGQIGRISMGGHGTEY